MKVKAQDGFTLVEGLLTILVLVVTAFVGYSVWDKQDDKEDDDNKKVSNSKPINDNRDSQPKSDESDSWTLYETPDNAYSIRLADGLMVMKSDEGDFLLSENPQYNKGQPVKYGAMPGRDSVLGFSVYFGVETVYGLDKATQQPSLKTKDGLEVKKYVFTQETEEEGIGLPRGATDYTYVVQGKGKTVEVGYSTMDSGASLDTVEKMVKTIQIH